MADKHLPGGKGTCRLGGGQWGKKGDIHNTFNNKDTFKKKKKRYTASLVINVKHTFFFHLGDLQKWKQFYPGKQARK